MKNTKPYLKAYSALGETFEYLNDDCGYEQWSQYLIDKLKELGAGVKGVDIGCGNGYFTRALNRAGYAVTGVDISPQMLNTAIEKSAADGFRPDYFLQDILKLKLNFKADYAVAVNDCINYVPQEKLTAAFSRVYKNLKKGGIFLFDISSEHKLRHILGDNLFAEDRDDVTCLWFTALKENRVEMDITVFTRLENGTYIRTDERQTQYIHTESKVIKLLEETGFSVRTEGHLGGSKDERINFICIKL